VISRIPQAAATIVPYDVQSRLRRAYPDLPEERITRAFERFRDRLSGTQPSNLTEHNEPEPAPEAVPIGRVREGQEVTVEGRLNEVTEERRHGRPVLQGQIRDATGTLVVEFDSLGDPDEIEAGQLLRVHGKIVKEDGFEGLALIGSNYEIVDDVEGGWPP